MTKRAAPAALALLQPWIPGAEQADTFRLQPLADTEKCQDDQQKLDGGNGDPGVGIRYGGFDPADQRGRDRQRQRLLELLQELQPRDHGHQLSEEPGYDPNNSTCQSDLDGIRKSNKRLHGILLMKTKNLRPSHGPAG